MTADDIKLEVPQEKETLIGDMLRKNEKLWLLQLCASKVTERIFLIQDVKRFISHPFRSGSKTREIEQSKKDKQISPI